ncbi:hypothetical protein KAM644c_17580 [Klebsiella quasipneumoniae subsp. quasipneumoniae]|uniref:Uncharacterized protein n=2 Tax=Enterobacteriaceae TaxID=543 RepID=A0AAN1Y3Y3_9ENTR|nr:hypothetical protein [Klebsiella pneumoniae]BDO12692.1 hypothetical protein KAM644c_17580 [Klebsiella quasipneumoniae subsp. quasipneumoniae]BDO18667.1 hypothetical protein KAM645c_17570 [Klebsiella quasipneumoniae subsp. quasipneumoniae]
MVEYISATINGLWECYLSWSKQKRELTISKLEALSNLLIDNRAYLRDFAHQGIKDAQKELELAKEWRRVGLLFQDISPELSYLCEQKSDYWIYSDRYTKRKVNELGITIRNLEHKLRMAKENLL